MTIECFIDELNSYDKTLPVILKNGDGRYKRLSFSDIIVEDDVVLSNLNHKVGKALILEDY